MTDSSLEREQSPYLAFDRLTFYVGNAKQAASFYTTQFGFNVIYHHVDPNTHVCTYVLRQNNIHFVLKSVCTPEDCDDIHKHVRQHGDGVKDIAFRVTNCREIYHKAIERGAISVHPPTKIVDDYDSITKTVATIQTYGDTTHTFIEYRTEPFNDEFVHGPDLLHIDHVVGNQPANMMESVVKWYEHILNFHRFWSVDETQVYTQYSALRSVVMADASEVIKMPLNEPVNGLRTSQIEEFINYYGGSGVQHVALRTANILKSVDALRRNGVQFLTIPDAYYKNLAARLRLSSVAHPQLVSDLNEIQRLGILVDFDEDGYLLQIFTQPVSDRPTLFFEIIQRHNHNGFGAGNFKALFEAIEDSANS